MCQLQPCEREIGNPFLIVRRPLAPEVLQRLRVKVETALLFSAEPGRQRYAACLQVAVHVLSPPRPEREHPPGVRVEACALAHDQGPTEAVVAPPAHRKPCHPRVGPEPL